MNARQSPCQPNFIEIEIRKPDNPAPAYHKFFITLIINQRQKTIFPANFNSRYLPA